MFADRLIWDVPALKVRFVPVAKRIPDSEDSVTVLLPSAIVRVFVLDEDKAPAVTVKLAVSKNPCVTVKVLLLMFNASPSVTVMPEPLTVTPLNVLPAVVSVPVPVNITLPVWV